MDDDLSDDPLHPSNLAPTVQAVLSDRCSAPFGTYLAEADGSLIHVSELWADGDVANYWTLTVQQAAVLVARVEQWPPNVSTLDVELAVGDAMQVGAKRAA